LAADGVDVTEFSIIAGLYPLTFDELVVKVTALPDRPIRSGSTSSTRRRDRDQLSVSWLAFGDMISTSRCVAELLVAR
jgi:hypothetical protein